ncbi:MAG TPA: HAD family phosphatase [Bryobacteraceae bacterium]|nr:HAD family phosphatase [Bryobacteraceae bacterium]
MSTQPVLQQRIQPRAVLFDYGNVLCRPQHRAEVEAMAGVLAVPADRFEEAYWKDRLLFDEGAITPEAYWSGVASALSRTLANGRRERLIELDNQSWSHPDPVMVRWAIDLRAAGVRTAVLSNMPITLRVHLRSCEWLPEFDYSCYSCDVLSAKPAPEIFRNCLRGVGAAPEEALFLDDRAENVEAARALGIHAIQFAGPEQAQCEIEPRYDLPLAIRDPA